MLAPVYVPPSQPNVPTCTPIHGLCLIMRSKIQKPCTTGNGKMVAIECNQCQAGIVVWLLRSQTLHTYTCMQLRFGYARLCQEWFSWQIYICHLHEVWVKKWVMHACSRCHDTTAGAIALKPNGVAFDRNFLRGLDRVARARSQSCHETWPGNSRKYPTIRTDVSMYYTSINLMNSAILAQSRTI